MARTVKEWQKYSLEQGTSGDMVFDVLKDWSEEVANHDAEVAVLQEALGKLSDFPCLTELLGEFPEDNGGCGCARCVARAVIANVSERVKLVMVVVKSARRLREVSRVFSSKTFAYLEAAETVLDAVDDLDTAG